MYTDSDLIVHIGMRLRGVLCTHNIGISNFDFILREEKFVYSLLGGIKF